jgi:hypothetical protein
MINLKQPNGSSINTWQEWTRPKKDYQWKTGRSALELARAWFRQDTPQPPKELLSLLHSSKRLSNLKLISGIPELVTALLERGEGRNHDLALNGNTDREQVTITIEAKADEPFGNDTILEYWSKAIKRRERGESTRVPERIEQLLSLVDPDTPVNQTKWKDIRYQLLTALCGTIIQAQIDGSSLAVLVVHVFDTELIEADKHAHNHNELELFLSVLADKPMIVENGKMYDGFRVNGIDLMVGKVVTTLR